MNAFARRCGARRIASQTLSALLPPRATWSASLQRGDRVTCEIGFLWLTQSGDPTDYLLRAGESFTAKNGGRVVAQACEYSRLRVEVASTRADYFEGKEKR